MNCLENLILFRLLILAYLVKRADYNIKTGDSKKTT